jgi:hypothetical protein
MSRGTPRHRTAPRTGSLAGRPVALASPGEALELPCVHATQPILAVRGRWADPRVAGNMGVTQGVQLCVVEVADDRGEIAAVVWAAERDG